MASPAADPDRAIRSVVVIGGGIVALSTALAFRHALPQVAVTMVETPPDPAALADRLTTAWPSIHRFHAAIGLSDTQLIGAGAATPLLGTRFEDASAGTPPFFLVHGHHGVPIGSVPFHEIWARAWRAGRARPYADYATAAVLAAAGRFVHPEDDPRSPLSTYDYGWRLDPSRYRDLLAAIADRAGIGRTPGTVRGIVRRADGGVTTLGLADGRAVVADLFVDCAGPAAPLASLLDARLTDWNADLPADRVMFGDRPPLPTGSCDTAATTPQGWRWEARLPDRTIVGAAFRSGAEKRAAALLDMREPEIVPLRPGWRDPWRHNVLAIGDAAVALGPVPGVHLHLAHLAIARALDLLPGRDCHPSEIDEYRRRAALQMQRLRDFLMLFEAGSMPDSTTAPIDQFVRRGRFTPADDDAIPSDMWIAALIGRGFVPQATSALASAVDEPQADALLSELAEGLATLPRQLPAYAAYLASLNNR